MTFTRSRPEGCVSDLLLDRLIAGEIVDAEARRHVESCALCSARLQKLGADAAGFAELPPRKRTAWRVPLVLVFSAVAAFVFFGGRQPGRSSRGSKLETPVPSGCGCERERLSFV